jgi:hypothetical protein
MTNQRELGPVLSFLLPSLKLKQRDQHAVTVEERLHLALLQNFGGYTAAAGNIFGFWREEGHDIYGEHREYRVALRQESARAKLERYLAELAAEIDESEIYCETGGRAYTVGRAEG